MRFSAQTTKNLYFRLSLRVWLVFLLFFQIQSFAQTVNISRYGFRYCEPFTNSTTRANTVFPRLEEAAEGISAFLTSGLTDPVGDGFWRLSNDDPNKRGSAFINLPFALNSGIRVSFEYFIYGENRSLVRADGLSFFLFDGSIPVTDFRIGGRGGLLGYAPHKHSNGSDPQLGLKGAYFGLAVYSFKNFVNENEGRFGGLNSTSKYISEPGAIPGPQKEFPNSIIIKGPESDNYVFIDGNNN